MLTNENLPEHLRGLLSLGEEQSLRTDQEGWRDYVAEFSLLAGDIPALLEALEWWFQWHREDDYPDAPISLPLFTHGVPWVNCGRWKPSNQCSLMPICSTI